MGYRVAIVGAGYAGMAAAVTLAGKGIPVTVFESGSVPGGRARRVATQGTELDNGQHILIGAYATLFSLMHQVGVPPEAVLRLPLEIRYPGRFRLSARRLGLLAGMLAARGIPLRERLGAIRFLSRMRRARFRLDEDMPVDELLARHAQSGAIAHYLWRPLCVSALNTPSVIASSRIFLAVLRDTLGAAPGAADLVLPRVDLSRLFPEPAAAFVRAKGGEIRLSSPVHDLEPLKRKFSDVIVAVGPHQLKALLPGMAPEYTYQPITTCYLQYREQVRLPFPMLGLADGLVQWVFDRGTLLGEHGRLACVISAQGDHQQMTRGELAQRCHQELVRTLGSLPSPAWSRVIAEKRATITCEVELRRPSVEIKGVHLAGDYTDPDYPPTLEAAVRSGMQAAERALAVIV
ncbi:MAG TPA: hydroxysqualene dehydroxylase HpnE [Burkholderiales bacterium]|nr:hydroxysqualene dehydroxylase HpnE [Burkholderiales bacterium]